MIVSDWSKYPNFSASEFRCKETGEIEMQANFLEKLQTLRYIYGRPMRITSGYRSPRHGIEAAKQSPGYHSRGMAADIAVTGRDAHDLVFIAMRNGFNGIGIAKTFVHLDTRPHDQRTIWTY
jgi:zinc D-Ala-D-Ala carboxypeptidase